MVPRDEALTSPAAAAPNTVPRIVAPWDPGAAAGASDPVMDALPPQAMARAASPKAQWYRYELERFSMGRLQVDDSWRLG
jgi:hypothetical protein